MKTKALMSLTSFFVAASILSQPAWAESSAPCDLEADKCSQSPLKGADSDKSFFLADKVNKELEDLYQKNLALGKDTKVVLIARRGQNTKKFKILKDNDAQETLQAMIARLQAESKQKHEENPDRNKTYRDGDIDHWVMKDNINEDDKLKYSHLGIAFRNMELKSPTDGSTITGPTTGRWAFYHLLYSCNEPMTQAEQEAIEKFKLAGDTAGLAGFLAAKKAKEKDYVKKSHIFKGTVHSFFYDHLNSYKAQIIVPTQEIQNNLEDILLKKRQTYNFQENHYNALAKYEDLTQQNSNQFVLEALAAAMRPADEVRSRASAIAILRQTGYGGSKIIPTGLFSVLKANWIQELVSDSMPTMCFKTQPDLKEYGVAEIVTSNSVLNWMRRNRILDEVHETKLEDDLMEDLERFNRPETKKTKHGPR